jgi:hypothetical protein
VVVVWPSPNVPRTRPLSLRFFETQLLMCYYPKE